ncbi:sensor histidine kinase [Nocardia salmonicida]|uniref:sensor histidine kinase n=1 Tax=Nocardia salmonicida TaxID=53431 RepID=UPI0007A41629|nr:ATP-binding protein [Nocardia salmonicida]
MTHRTIALVGGVTAGAAALSVAVVLSVDWSEQALHDPARILLLGPHEAFAAAQHSSAFGWPELAVFLLTGATFVAAGLFTWTTRPHDRAGQLFVAGGLVWLICGVRRSSDPALFTAGVALSHTYLAVMTPVLISFPSGRLNRAWERWCVAGCWFLAVFGVAAEWLFFDPKQATGSSRSTSVNLLLIRHDPVIAERIQLVVGVCACLMGVTIISIMITRWRSGTAAYRSGFTPLMVSATIAGLLILWILFTAYRFPGSMYGWMLYLLYIPTVPMAFAYGQVRYRMARAAVGDAMVEIGSAPISSGFVEALRRALHDPTVELWTYDSDRPGYVDDQGTLHELPRGEGHRAATVLERDGAVSAALVYDEQLQTEPELLATVHGATELALDYEHLRKDLQAQLAEVRRSRERIVAAGDAERRRVERDLHDGAQQRLVAAALLLRRAQRAADTEARDDLVTLGAAELDTALCELRELARGVFPPILAERGLTAALTSLAERAPIAVRIHGALVPRPPAGVELAAYFIAAEAVTNAAKHSGGTHVDIQAGIVDEAVRLVIADDGRGGAHIGPGGGLSGLGDRAAALGGHLRVDSSPGVGTVLTATLPLRAEDTS